jgi:maltose/maltodextrin transport system permease protein
MILLHRLFSAIYCVLVIAFVVSTALGGLLFWRVGEVTYSLTCFAIMLLAAVIYFHPRFYNLRFVAPALLALSTMIVVPVIYTISLSFTNLSESNRLNYRRALPYIESQTYIADGGLVASVYGWQSAEGLHLYLQDQESETWYTTSSPLEHDSLPDLSATLQVTNSIPDDKFDRKFAISQRNFLDTLTLTLPNGTELSKDKLRTFAERQPRFTPIGNQQFLDNETGDTILANHSTGQFEIVESDDADRLGGFVSPTFLKSSNLDSYRALMLDTGQLTIFFAVFLWSVFAATFTVSVSYFVALIAASLLNWPALREREWIKFVLIACYALPAFAVINSFFWFFSTDQAPWGATLPGGPVFTFVQHWFGLEIDWQFSPVFSRIKFLIVQFWMFMPFMLILCLGVIQSIPPSVYEAAKLEGAGTRASFFRITLPMTFIPLAPVLLIAFATAFNDLSLVDQLTYGFPEIPGSVPLASHVDLLVSFANRQAFGNVFNQGAGFGYYSLASTLFTLIFIVLAVISYVYLRLVKGTRYEQ